MPKTSFYKETAGSRLSTPLGETSDPVVATRVENTVRSLLNPKPRGHVRQVKVVAIDPEHFAKFAKTGKKPSAGQVFESAVQASTFIGAHFNALTSALSVAKRNAGKGPVKATVRGITFTYAE